MQTDAQRSLNTEAELANAQADAVKSEAVGAEALAQKLREDADRAEADAKIIRAKADEARRRTEAEGARTRAAKFMEERRFAEARKALEEADALEAIPAEDSGATTAKKPGFFEGVKARLKKTQEAPATEPVAKSLAIVSLYSKIAAGVGLLPGGLLNFAGILAIQITMVWKIANVFGERQGKDRIRGAILSLIGSALPGSIGHSIGLLAVASIPVVGSIIGLVATPAVAYAMTEAVGRVFTMHFESGGTLLTFDPKAFQEYFLKEFEKAGGKLKPAGAPA